MVFLCKIDPGIMPVIILIAGSTFSVFKSLCISRVFLFFLNLLLLFCRGCWSESLLSGGVREKRLILISAANIWKGAAYNSTEYLE
jgi:hypothetical protein